MRIVTSQGVIEIPLAIEAQGAAAIDAYIAQHLAESE